MSAKAGGRSVERVCQRHQCGRRFQVRVNSIERHGGGDYCSMRCAQQGPIEAAHMVNKWKD